MEDIDNLLQDGQKAIEQALDLKALDTLRVEYLGKNGTVTQLLKQLGQLSPDEKRDFGQRVNQAKETLHLAIERRKQQLNDQNLQRRLQQETLDVTLPGRGGRRGSLHPVTRTIHRINQWFSHQGFTIEDGPDIEEDYYNFEALNFPLDHPARAMHDTFYFPDGKLLRTHTSPVQIRAMEQGEPPFRMIAAGKVYRCDFDVTHTPMFHQVEGLVVDKGIHFGHLKGILEDFMCAFFEKKLKMRFRSSYFPFTEPSAEVDIECVICEAKGCRVCSHTGWLEMLGCGMVHPNVLKYGQVDSEIYTGFAFGMGVERLAMIRYGVQDLRLFFDNDLRFLNQFQ